MKILCCDNDPDITAMLEQALTHAGHEVQVVGSARDCLRIYHRALVIADSGGTVRPFDSILLDLAMPDMDGFSVLQSIRNTENHSPPTPRARVIYITAHPQLKEDSTLIARTDADGYLEKPFAIADLLALLEKQPPRV